MTVMERDDYKQSLLHYLDLEDVVEAAVEKAVRNRVIEIAKSLLETPLSNKEIAKHTGLTIQQVEKLRHEINKN